MNQGRLYFEIFEEFEKASGKNKIEVLRKYESKAFKNFLCCAMSPSISFDIKEVPVFRPAVEPAGLNFAYLDTEMPKMYRFIKNHPNRPVGFTAEKSTSQLQVILEALHKDESAIFAQLIQGKYKIKGLTVALAKEAFPEINV